MICEEVEDVKSMDTADRNSFYKKYLEFSKKYEELVKAGVTSHRGFTLDTGVSGNRFSFNNPNVSRFK